jgi:hypothetical protein
VEGGERGRRDEKRVQKGQGGWKEDGKMRRKREEGRGGEGGQREQAIRRVRGVGRTGGTTENFFPLLLCVGTSRLQNVGGSFRACPSQAEVLPYRPMPVYHPQQKPADGTKKCFHGKKKNPFFSL